MSTRSWPWWPVDTWRARSPRRRARRPRPPFPDRIRREGGSFDGVRHGPGPAAGGVRRRGGRCPRVHGHGGQWIPGGPAPRAGARVDLGRRFLTESDAKEDRSMAFDMAQVQRRGAFAAEEGDVHAFMAMVASGYLEGPLPAPARASTSAAVS